MSRSTGNPGPLALGIGAVVLGLGLWALGSVTVKAGKTKRKRRGPRVKKRRDPKSGRRTVRTFDGKKYTQDGFHNTKKDAESRAQQIRKAGGAARVVGGRIRGATSSLYVVYRR